MIAGKEIQRQLEPPTRNTAAARAANNKKQQAQLVPDEKK
jgi:hypothetical protein